MLSINVDHYAKERCYFYHSVIVISFSLSHSDHMKRRATESKSDYNKKHNNNLVQPERQKRQKDRKDSKTEQTEKTKRQKDRKKDKQGKHEIITWSSIEKETKRQNRQKDRTDRKKDKKTERKKERQNER